MLGQLLNVVLMKQALMAALKNKTRKCGKNVNIVNVVGENLLNINNIIVYIYENWF